MRERILSLSGRTEVILVLLLAFGVTVPPSLRALLSPESLASRAPPITNEALHRTVLYELGVMVFLIPFLRVRGWTRERLGIQPTVKDSLWGVGILLAYYLGFVVLVNALATVWPQAVLAASRIRLNGGAFDWPSITAVSLVNPVFEEVFVCGYVITALRERFGTTTAVNVSAAIRVFYHFYQGALGVLGTAPMALLFAYWFARTGRLWPLIVAHALQDFTALAVSMEAGQS
jgi:membrane protease YdiL (CAAX protease family)